MIGLTFHKVTQLPVTPLANAVYFVSDPQGDVVDGFVTSSNGVARPLTNTEMVRALIDARMADTKVSHHYIHTQDSAASSWTINHNLGYKPSVTLMTVGGVEFDGEVTYTSLNQVVAVFSVPVAGTAHCT